jgi:serine protease Do
MRSLALFARLGAGLVGLVTVLGPVPSCHRSTGTTDRGAAAPAQAAPAAPSNVSGAAALSTGPAIADVAAKVTPSVVNVFSERSAPNVPELSPFFSDPFFRYFFDLPGRGAQPPSRRQQSLGSGVIVASDGVIITNDHVVSQADKIRVALKDGRELQAKLVGSDPKSDVAVLRVDAKDLPAIPIGDSSKIRIGDLVLAIGNPFGIGQTVTMGIVSAVGRANMGITEYEDFIQTDAAINPGNSGGALVTMDGRLAGINTAIASRTGGYQGVGFAIPSNMVVEIQKAILQEGKVIRGWLGVSIQDVTSDLGQSLNLPDRSGVLVSDVSPGSPAAAAGLKRGDVIIAIDGAKTTDTGRLRNLVALAGKGKKVRVEVLRDGKPRTLDVTLAEAPAELAPGRGGPMAEGTGLFSGLGVQELDAESRERLRIPAGIRGVLVSRIDRDSPVLGSGLRMGDVILEVNRSETPTVEAFRRAAGASARRALLLVYREGSTVFMVISK